MRSPGIQAAFGWADESRENDPRLASSGGRGSRGHPLPPPRNILVRGDENEGPLPPDTQLWDVRAAARFLKRSVSWVYHKAEDGTLPVRRLDGWGVRFVPAELRAWVVEHGQRPGRCR